MIAIWGKPVFAFIQVAKIGDPPFVINVAVNHTTYGVEPRHPEGKPAVCRYATAVMLAGMKHLFVNKQFGKFPWFPQFRCISAALAPNSHSVSRSMPVVSNPNHQGALLNNLRLRGDQTSHRVLEPILNAPVKEYMFQRDISPQFFFGGIFSSLNQILSGDPQSSRVQNEKSIEKCEQPFSRVVEKSVVPLMLCGSLLFGFFVFWLGDRLRAKGYRCVASGIVLGGLFVAAFGWLVPKGSEQLKLRQTIHALLLPHDGADLEPRH